MAESSGGGFWEFIASLFQPNKEKAATPETLAQRLERAIERDQAQHSELVMQVATIMGSAKKLRIQLDEKQQQINILTNKIRTAVAYQNDFVESGNTAKADEFAQIARTLATELLKLQADYADLEQLSQQADAAAATAKKKAEESKRTLRASHTEHERLRNQLAQSELQKTIAKSYRATLELPGATGINSAPTLNQVRDEIQTQYTTALSEVELAQELEPSPVSTRALDDLTENLEASDLLEKLSDPKQLPPVRRDRVDKIMKQLESRTSS